MAANDQILGTVQYVVESAQGAQSPVHNGLDAKTLSTTTASQVPYLMFDGAYRFFSPPAGTQVFACKRVIVPPQGFLLIKLRSTVASKAFDSTGSTSGFVRITVLEQDLSLPASDPVTRQLSEADRNTTRLADDPTFSSSVAVFNEAYAFQPGNGRAWLIAGPQNLDFRTTA